jgi:hypothetical protein
MPAKNLRIVDIEIDGMKREVSTFAAESGELDSRYPFNQYCHAVEICFPLRREK